MNFKIILLFFYLLIIPRGVLGTGASFLKMDVGAKGAAMGGAYTALTNDATSIYWNPAGLAQIKQPECNFMHNKWFSNINYEFLAAAYPTENLTFAISFAYLYMDEIKEIVKDTEGRGNGRYWETGKVFTAEDIALSVAFAQALEENLFIGTNFKYINEGIADESASGWAMDLGILFKPANKLRFGFVIQNLGPKMKFIKDEFSLPLTYRTGIAYQIGEKINLALEIDKTKDEKLDACAGMELWFGNWLVLRFSGRTKSDDKLGKFKGLPTGLTVGSGFNLGRSATLDYAYVPYGDLGDTHRISIAMKLGQEKQLSLPKFKPKEIADEIIEPELKQPEKTPKEKETIVYVKIDNVTIWQGPGSNYPRIVTVSKGSKLRVLDTSKKWYYKVMLEDGTIGWICSTFVEW